MIRCVTCIILVLGISNILICSLANPSLVKHRQSTNYETFYEEEENHLVVRKTKSKDEGFSIDTYTDLFAVHFEQNCSTDHIVKSGLVFVRKVFEDEDIYLFRYPVTAKYNKMIDHTILNDLSIKKQIRWIEQQLVLIRQQRRFFVEENSTPRKKKKWKAFDFKRYIKYNSNIFKNQRNFLSSVKFNDPLLEDQWYLLGKTRNSSSFHDVNVLPVWKAGFTGKGIRISVLDDGVSPENAEIYGNYDPVISYDFTEFQNGVQEGIAENSHGTYCAAIVAGVANNSYCGVGVAYDAKIGGARVLNGLITDVQEASGLIHALKYVDIYTASWGPKDDGRHVAGPGFLARKALMKGVTKGRRGKGAIYVWASGNGGRYFDNCNLDGYASSPFTLTFGALTEKGESTYYTEPCAAVIASAYVGGLHLPPTKENLASYRKMIKVIVPDACGKCRENFQGTSAAAPIAAGIIALILQVNPNLTWRDVQHLIINTARIPSSAEEGWSINASGKHFHLKIGFGVLDAALAVAIARDWTSVSPLRKFSSNVIKEKKFIEAQKQTRIYIDVHHNTYENSINSLETVIATLNIEHVNRGNLEIQLVSPSGTLSQLLTLRLLDNTTLGYSMWDFTSLHFWAESPFGRWKLLILDHGRHTNSKGYINYFRLTFYGTNENVIPSKRTEPILFVGRRKLQLIHDEEEARSIAAIAELAKLWTEN